MAPLVFGPACDCSEDPGGTGGGGGGGVAGGTPVPDGGFPDGGVVVIPGVDGGESTVCQITACPDGNVVYQCGDCVDNDGDGKVDTGTDPDCLGPCHNNESGYNIGLTGQPETQCRVDCYYDSDSGRGCDWSWECDPFEPRLNDSAMCEYVGESTSVIGNMDCGEVSATHDDPGACEDCLPLTPPGCDCFGCCELPARSGNFLFIGTLTEAGVRTCDFDAAIEEYEGTEGMTPEQRLAILAQADRDCRICTPIDTCYRPCDVEGDPDDDCNVCLGETERPEGCEEPEPPACDGGATCAPISDDICPAGESCFFGCCEAVVPL